MTPYHQAAVEALSPHFGQLVDGDLKSVIGCEVGFGPRDIDCSWMVFDPLVAILRANAEAQGLDIKVAPWTVSADGERLKVEVGAAL